LLSSFGFIILNNIIIYGGLDAEIHVSLQLLFYFSMVITGAIITAPEVLPVSTQNGTMQQL